MYHQVISRALEEFNYNLTPPILATREQEPTPAFLTEVGISSEVHIHNTDMETPAQKLLIMLRITIGSSPGYFPLNKVYG